jgi:hypothetical protein
LHRCHISRRREEKEEEKRSVERCIVVASSDIKAVRISKECSGRQIHLATLHCLRASESNFSLAFYNPVCQNASQFQACNHTCFHVNASDFSKKIDITFSNCFLLTWTRGEEEDIFYVKTLVKTLVKTRGKTLVTSMSVCTQFGSGFATLEGQKFSLALNRVREVVRASSAGANLFSGFYLQQHFANKFSMSKR